MECLSSSLIGRINKNKAGYLLDGRAGDDMPGVARIDGGIGLTT